jgi:hypothetical protein
MLHFAQNIHCYHITDGHAAGTGYCLCGMSERRAKFSPLNMAEKVSLWGGVRRLPPSPPTKDRLYVMLCYVMLCYVMFVTLRYVKLC